MVFLEIITPGKKIFTGEVKLIQVPGEKGSFEILKNHAPIISTLEKGIIKVINMKDEQDFFDINGGVIEVNKNKIIILAESEQE
ncbi:MAG: ATP synthase F1 subunit epsilon [Bacteroidales bacterium]|nr:MAG: ATP synthase F1 subunit epsilon [Bacteroidales bacterium]